MFFAARTFAFKMGQALALVVFTSITVSGSEAVSGSMSGSVSETEAPEAETSVSEEFRGARCTVFFDLDGKSAGFVRISCAGVSGSRFLRDVQAKHERPSFTRRRTGF